MIKANAAHMPLQDESVQSIITSPPYWGLRKYDVPDLVWDGDAGCEHKWGDEITQNKGHLNTGFNERYGNSPGQKKQEASSYGKIPQGQFCQKCGAWRGGLGLEPTVDLYMAHLMQVVAECWRVLKADGVCFVNIGDTYGGNAGGGGDGNGRNAKRKGLRYPQKSKTIPKSLCLVPERFVIACQEAGWIIRNKPIWLKPNAMPSSTQDNFSGVYENIYFLAKSTKDLCWRHERTKRWLWAKPKPDYIWINRKTGEETKEEPLNRRTETYLVSGKRVKLWYRKNLWRGFDYYFDLDAVRAAHKPKTLTTQGIKFKKDTKTDELGRIKAHNFNNSMEVHKINPAGVNPGDVWSIATQPYPNAHYSTFPEKLVERMLLCSTAPGDRVLDPFGGSGTVGRVAIRLQRKPVLLDLAYHGQQAKRMRVQVEMCR